NMMGPIRRILCDLDHIYPLMPGNSPDSLAAHGKATPSPEALGKSLEHAPIEDGTSRRPDLRPEDGPDPIEPWRFNDRLHLLTSTEVGDLTCKVADAEGREIPVKVVPGTEIELLRKDVE